jgi:hypothetical protein
MKNVNELAVGDVIQAPDQLAAHGTTHGKIESIGPDPERGDKYLAFILSPDGKPDERVTIHLEKNGVVPTR